MNEQGTALNPSSFAAVAKPATPTAAQSVAPPARIAPAANPATSAAVIERGKRFEIKVADEKFRGNLAGVQFQKGVGYTDDPHAAHAVKQYGASVADHLPAVVEGD